MVFDLDEIVECDGNGDDSQFVPSWLYSPYSPFKLFRYFISIPNSQRGNIFCGTKVIRDYF